MFTYFLHITEAKQQNSNKVNEEKPNIKPEKQSKKNPQTIPRIEASSFFKNIAQHMAKGKTNVGFALKTKDNISADCSIKNKKEKATNKVHFLYNINFFLVITIPPR